MSLTAAPHRHLTKRALSEKSGGFPDIRFNAADTSPVHQKVHTLVEKLVSGKEAEAARKTSYKELKSLLSTDKGAAALLDMVVLPIYRDRFLEKISDRLRAIKLLGNANLDVTAIPHILVFSESSKAGDDERAALRKIIEQLKVKHGKELERYQYLRLGTP